MHMLEVGTLIRWQEPYADGIVKDAGTGVILKIFSYELEIIND